MSSLTGKRKNRPSTSAEPSEVKKSKVELEEITKQISIRKNYPSLYRKVKDNAKERNKLFNQVKNEENIYRELFAQDRDSKELNDPEALLIDVHKDADIFNFITESDEESKIPRILPLSGTRSKKEDCIVTEKQFKKNFDLFTENQFREVNWDNILVAGGCVLACLQPNPGKTPKDIRNYFHKDAYKNSDIDIFIYGLNVKEANEKMKEIYENICDSLPGGEEVICFRSQHAVTIISKFPFRHIQIILRLYKSPAEILMGFDVDCCAVGYNGKSVLMTPRAHHAITYQVNTVDMTRRSPSYEMRLSKYSRRGYSILIESLDEQKIDPQIFERRFDQVQGLAKLILITKLDSAEARTAYKERQRARKLRPEAQSTTSFLDLLDCGINDEEDLEYNAERLECGASASDYSTVFLPWGPKWNAKRIRKLMYTKDMILNSKWYDPKKKYHTHPCFFGTASEIIKDCCGNCPPIPKEDQDPDTPYVSGELSWLDINPGQQTALQRIGSFHPITEGDWTEGAYISSEIEEICAAINSDNVDKLTDILKNNPNINLNQRDSSGRTPLHIAAFSNSVNAAKFLIFDKHVRVSNKMNDGRSALHICAQYGHYEIISFLIKRGAELEEEAEQRAKEEQEKKDSMDIDEEEEEEEDDENMDEDSEEVDDEFCIKNIVEQQKKEKEEMLAKMNPYASDDLPDILDIEEKDWDNKFTPLQFSCFYGKSKAIRILIDEGGANIKLLDANQNFTTAMLCILNNHVRALKILLAKDYPLSHVNGRHQTALEFACSKLSYACAKLLINHNKNQKITYCCMSNAISAEISLKDNEEEDLNNKKKKKNNDKSFILPTKKDKIKFIKLLLDNGGSTFDDNPNSNNSNIKNQKTSERENLGGGAFSANGRQCLIFNVCNDIELLQLFLKNDNTLVNAINGNNTILDIALSNVNSKNFTKPNNLQKCISTLITKQNTPVPLSLYQMIISALKVKYTADKNSITKQQIIEDVLTEIQKFLNNHYPQIKQTSKKTKSRTRSKSSNVDIKDLDIPKQGKAWIKNKENIEKLRKSNQDIVDLIKSYGGKTFLEYRFTNTEMKKRQTLKKRNNTNNYYKNNDNKKIQLPDISFSPIMEQYSRNHYDINQQKIICGLFDAVIEDNTKQLKKLTIDKPIGKQAHISCYCSFNNMGITRISPSPLFYAIQNDDNMDLLNLIIDICLKQFTPLTRKKKKDDFIPTINNHELLKLMRQNIKPGDYLDTSGKSTYREDEYEPDDPNAKPAFQLNCTTSPSTFLKYSSLGYNVFHIAAYYGCSNSCNALINKIKHEKIKYFRIIDDDDAKSRGKEIDTSTESLLSDLISGESNNNRHNDCKLSPFNIAIARGNKNMAELLLLNGGLKVITEEDLPEVYAGLDVGGQKMDWALDHHASTETTKEHNSIHIAAYFNKPEMIEFIVKQAPSIWRKSYKTQYPDRDIPDLPDDLKLNSKHYSYTPLHLCCFFYNPNSSNSQNRHYWRKNQNTNKKEDSISRLDAARAILDLDNSIINTITTKEGLTPLMIASHNNNLDIVNLLIERKAILDMQCKERGWTALHYAVNNNSFEVVKLLINTLPKSQINIKSKEFYQTPLTLAAFLPNSEILKFMIESNKCDIFTRDVGGDFPINHAIRTENLESVKLLLDAASDSDEYLKENGVNQTILDIAVLSLASNHEINKNSSISAMILKLVYDSVGYERSLSQYKYVRSITDIMIQQTILEQSKKSKKKQNYWHREPITKGNWKHIFSLNDIKSIYLPRPFQEDDFISPKDININNYLDYYDDLTS